MIQLKSIDLDDHHALKLKAWQKKIDDLHTYSDRVDQGKASFKAKNTNTNSTFTHVKSKLTAMCHGARRCAYCEDSVANAVEHIHPKDLYPDLVFSWENYLYACGPDVSPIDKIRAQYTIDVLHLNDRDYLVTARRIAFGNYRARLVEYGKEKLNHASQPVLDRLRDELLLVGHRTVWREMQRQHTNYPVLSDLFNAAPEALSW